MKLIVVTREELTSAMSRYNKHLLENPDMYDEINDDESCAENQVDNIIEYISDGHIDEATQEMAAETVSAFIDHCEDEGIMNIKAIADDLTETFFKA